MCQWGWPFSGLILFLYIYPKIEKEYLCNFVILLQLDIFILSAHLNAHFKLRSQITSKLGRFSTAGYDSTYFLYQVLLSTLFSNAEM